MGTKYEYNIGIKNMKTSNRTKLITNPTT